MIELFKSQNYEPVGLAAKPVPEVLNEISNITFKTVKVQEFYETIAQMPDSKSHKAESPLNNSFTACVGGSFRSLRMARFLAQKGISLSDNVCKNGFKILDLKELVENAKVTAEGYLLPQGFVSPIKTLFVSLDMDTPEAADDVLLCFLNSLLAKQCGHEAKIKLDVVFVDDDETEGGILWQRYKQPDNTPSPPAYPLGF